MIQCSAAYSCMCVLYIHCTESSTIHRDLRKLYFTLQLNIFVLSFRLDIQWISRMHDATLHTPLAGF